MIASENQTVVIIQIGEVSYSEQLVKCISIVSVENVTSYQFA